MSKRKQKRSLSLQEQITRQRYTYQEYNDLENQRDGYRSDLIRIRETLKEMCDLCDKQREELLAFKKETALMAVKIFTMSVESTAK